MVSCDPHPHSEIASQTRPDKKIMLVSLECTHPIGGTVLFRIEKYAFTFEDPATGSFSFFYDLEKNTPCLYEPNMFLIPLPEFVIKMVIGIPQVNEDSIILEFSANISSLLSAAEPIPKTYEIVYSNNGYQINIGISALIDANHDLINSLNIKLPWFESSNPGDLMKNKLITIRYIKISIPNTKKARVEPRKATTSSSLSNIRIDEDEEFDLANSPVVRNHRKKNANTREAATPINFEDHLMLETENHGRTCNSIESPMTNKSKNILSFTSFSPSSITESSFLNKGGSQFSQFSSDAIQQNPGLTLNKISSLKETADTREPRSADKTSMTNSLTNIDESTKHSTQLKSRDFAKSLSFLPNYESEDPRESSFNVQQYKLEDYIGQFGELIENPSGSKMIEAMIVKASLLELDTLINELIPHLSSIILDPYSNCMLLKLLQYCSPDQRLFLLSNIAPLIPSAAKHKKGTHSLQSIIALIKGDEEETLIEQSLQESVAELCKDQYGTHFIQKLVSTFSIPRIIFVFNIVVCYFLEIALHTHGLCVLKALISRLDKDQDRKRLIIQLLARYVEELIQNAYGNYAIQHAFDVYRESSKEIWDGLIPKAIQFCNQKYSSNVIEKCLETSSLEHRKKFVETVTRSDRLLDLMTNKYGNFVLQKVYTVADENDKKPLLVAIMKQLEKIHSAKYRAKWTCFVEDCKKTAKSDPFLGDKSLGSKNISNQKEYSPIPLDLQKRKQWSIEKYSSDSDDASARLQDNEIIDDIYISPIERNTSPNAGSNTKKKLSLKKSSQSFQVVNTGANATVDHSQAFTQQQQSQYGSFTSPPFIPNADNRFGQPMLSSPIINSPASWNSYPTFPGFQPSSQGYPTFIPIESNQNTQNLSYGQQSQSGSKLNQYLPEYRNY